MYYKKNFGILLSIFLYISTGYGQEHVFTTNININNRGSGIGLGLHQKSNNKVNTKFELNFMTLKDPKELLISNIGMSNSGIDPGTFKFGKVNQVLQTRLGYGKEITLAKRPDRNSIGLIVNATVGLNFALQIPVYIDYNTPGQNELGFVTERYNPEIHDRERIIQSHTYYNRGFTNAKFIPSIFIKQGLIMEFGNYTKTPNRIEGGIILDAFIIRPELMYKSKLPHIFPSFYISFAVLNFEI
ncbi:MAG: hypothetical protein J5I91_04925 [Bacteroidetes bacterium]|nr:hypothetical protein [Bacteroidota bacterium]